MGQRQANEPPQPKRKCVLDTRSVVPGLNYPATAPIWKRWLDCAIAIEAEALLRTAFRRRIPASLDEPTRSPRWLAARYFLTPSAIAASVMPAWDAR